MVRTLKRLFDFVLALALLFFLSPLIVLVALVVRLFLGPGPVLFRQRRPGKGGRIFEILKFRTMTDERGADGCLLPDGERMTGLGSFLRTMSLDELPELLNVIKGDMSLVGPRPLLVEYLPLYSADQSRRHEVNPGITGWAQVNGRNNLDWDERLQMDVWYVDNWSPWLDMKIILLTIVKVLKREGISRAGYATMPKFTGAKSCCQQEGAME